MRRFSTLVYLLCLAIPAGISISGCTRNPGANYCNGLGYGPKITDVASIDLEPRTTGISLAFGQTQQVSAPKATTCKGTSASVTSYTYGTTNNQLVDISPAGAICAGTWNRNSGGGIADYTICRLPNPVPSTGGLPYSSAFITASADAVSSNPVQVFVHPQVTSLSLVGPTTCQSQGVQSAAPLDVQACYLSAANPTGQSVSTLMCAPSSVTSNSASTPACSLPYVQGANGQFTQVPLSSIAACTSAIGTLTYSVGTSAIASINSETNQITAEMPGTTTITASVAGSGSSAGFFSTCPPATIKVTLANGSTSGTVTQGVTQNLVTTVYDTNINSSTGLGNPITGLTLDYQSTNPVNISAGATGSITTSFPGMASIFAVCQPSTCNPSPINAVGLDGTGLSIASNPVSVTTPGTASQYVWFGAPGQSEYFVPIELLTGTAGSTVRLPYVPNSMVMDQLGTNLYFGSATELMIYSTATNTLTKADPTVPGVVLAVSPNDSQLLINDQSRQVFYVYNATGTVAATFGGLGNAAAWSPDSKTLYITDSSALNDPTPSSGSPLITGHTDMLYVYNVNTGFTSYPLPQGLPTGTVPPVPAGSQPWALLEPNVAVTSQSQTPALTIPGVGAYLRGTSTVAHTWCPTGTIGNYATMSFYPLADTVQTSSNQPVQSDVLAATADGHHILSAALLSSGTTLTDTGLNIPSTACPAAVNNVLQPLTLSGSPVQTTLNIPATSLNQVVASPASNLAFITYNSSSTTGGALLPYYMPATVGTLGTVGSVKLAGGATAPIAGAFSQDDSIFFVSTAGDNLIHYITINPTGGAPTDTQQIAPNLPSCRPVLDAGCTLSSPAPTYVPATVITVKPRATT